MKNENETITVTIKKFDLGFLRGCVVAMDGAIQTLCVQGATDADIILSQDADALLQRKEALGRLSLTSTKGKMELCRVIDSIEKGAE